MWISRVEDRLRNIEVTKNRGREELVVYKTGFTVDRKLL